MRCRPWLWLWGLLPLALIVFLTTIAERQRVERDLTVRTEQTLQAEGLGWAKLRFEGRDGVLEGPAPSQAERVLAYDIARSIHGVRVLRNLATVETAVSPYTWQARRSGKQITMTGFMPDGDSRSAAVAQARERFPNADIVNEMQIAKGAPQGGLWATGTAFALRQLGHVKTGVVNLTDTTFEIAGRAASPASYKQLVDALRSRLPAGWTLGKQDLAIPPVETYTWSFDRLDADVVLNGYVPDEATRSRLVAAARKTYPDATVTDRMLVASGAPDGFDTFARAAIQETDDLDEVRITLQDLGVTVTGLAGTQFMSGDVADRLAAKGAGFKIANRLRTTSVEPPRADPYVWSARQRNNVIVMSGHVPNEAIRTRLTRKARDLYPDAVVRDDMTVASGTPKPEEIWTSAALQGLSAMAMFDKGVVELNGTDLRVSGETPDDAVRARGETILGTSAVSGFNVTPAFKLLEPEVDLAALARARAEEKAKQERARLAAIAAEEQAELERQEAERLRIIAEEKAAQERKRLAAIAAEEEAEREQQEAERLRLIAEEKAEQERQRLAAIAAANEARRLQAAKRDAERKARRKEYRLVAEYNGTPLALWEERRKARASNKDLSTIDETRFADSKSDSRGRLVLTGKVASPQMRIALRRHARGQFDGDVVDRLEVIDGADDPEWQAAAMHGISELSRLRNGAALVTQSDVDLYGDAVSGDAAQAVRAAIDSKTPARFEVSALVIAPKALEQAAVEEVLETNAPVEAGECGNLMNSIATFAPIQFASEKAEIRKVDTATLDKLALIAEKCPRARVRIAGHTDSRGPEAYNQKLSEERAEAVLAYLAEKGIARDRMRARGLGESQPLVSNDTRADRKKNRRIEFTVTEQ